MHTRPIRFDPHVHTAASYDSTAPVDAVLERASEACLDAVAITDHDTMAGAWEAVDRNVDGVTVVPGVEVSTADGHLLALGVGSCPDSGQSFVRTVEAVRAQGGIAIVPHPFQRSRHGVGQGALTDCDGIEAYNAMAMTGFRNRRARAFARNEGYPMLGGSDAHTPAVVGRAYTEVALPTVEPVTADLIVSAVRAGRTQVVGRRTSFRRYLAKSAYNARLRTTDKLLAVNRSILR